MSDIFLAYSSEDREFAARVAERLQAEGWSVFMDTHTRVGDRWHNAIEKELHSADAVVVLWSARSRESDFVLEEADYGKSKGNLFPAFIEAVEHPYGFRRIQTANLVGWAVEADHPGLTHLLKCLRGYLFASDPAPTPKIAPAVPRPPPARSATPLTPAPAATAPAQSKGVTLQVTVPDIGDFTDVPVIEVLVKAGDAIKAEDALITLESDKATMDVPSPSGGTVKEVLLKVGDKVSEGSLVLILEAVDAVAPAPSAAPEQDSAGRKAMAFGYLVETFPKITTGRPSASVKASTAHASGQLINTRLEIDMVNYAKLLDRFDLKDGPVRLIGEHVSQRHKRLLQEETDPDMRKLIAGNVAYLGRDTASGYEIKIVPLVDGNVFVGVLGDRSEGVSLFQFCENCRIEYSGDKKHAFLVESRETEVSPRGIFGKTILRKIDFKYEISASDARRLCEWIAERGFELPRTSE